MTTPATARRAGPYTGDGANVNFTFGFKVFATTDIAVYVTIAGTETLWVLNSNYTVTLNPDQVASPGGTVVASVAPALATSLSIIGALPYDQASSLPNGGAYNATVIEQAFDKCVMLTQQLLDKVNRAFRLADGDASGASTVLPTPAASAFLGWNAAGTALVNYTGLASAAVSAAWAAIISQSTLAAGKAAATIASSGLATASGITMATARLLGRITASTGAIEEISVGTGLSMAAGSLDLNKASIQGCAYTAVLTAGSSTAYTAAPSPALAARAEDQCLLLEFHATSGASPTLAISGLASRNLKVYNSAGAKVTPATGAFVTGMKSHVVDDGTDYVVLDPAPPAATPVVLGGHINGLVPSTAGGSTTLTHSAGSAADSTGVDTMVLASAMGKTTAAWAVGSGNGGIDTGAIANNTQYYFWLIKRVDTGVVDILFSLSATAPTMPANYTLKRLIGYGKTNGSAQWQSFTAFETGGGGISYNWTVAVLDVNLIGSFGTSRVSVALTVPLAFSTEAYVRTFTSGCTAALITSPNETTATPSTTAVPGANVPINTSAGLVVQTNASGQVAYQSDTAAATLQIWTHKFVWGRR